MLWPHYQQYSHTFAQKESKLSALFAEFAKNEAERAARLLALLRGYDEERKDE